MNRWPTSSSPWWSAARRPSAFRRLTALRWARCAQRPRPRGEFAPEFEKICARLAGTRPTAVNLFWAIDRMKRAVCGPWLGRARLSPRCSERLLAEAHAMYEEDIAACKTMGAFGGALLPDEGGVLTHCNAGALATCGYGTALGVIRSAVEQGKRIHVYADETRPFLQGARLTAWELMADGIPTTVICDNMAASLMRAGKIKAVVVGADRIAANGDFANKIGTYNVAILAKEHGIPFYCAAPWSTIDTATPTGDAIPIEERAAKEVTHHGGKQLHPHGVGICNPAFDVTPAKYVTAIITERGVLRAPYAESLKEMEMVAGRPERSRLPDPATRNGIRIVVGSTACAGDVVHETGCRGLQL